MSMRSVATKLPPIKIPNRIPRSKTDILKALSMTVGLDSTAPDYNYIDDPRLIPTNSYQRLAYRLSKESGLKAAKFFFEKYPECFHRDQSEPKIEAFTFKEIYDESMDLNEDDLNEAISNNQLTNAQTAYQVITKKGIEISDATKVELIQLLLFFRNTEPIDPDIKSSAVETPSPIVDPGISLDVFQSIKDKNTLAYSSIIAGLMRIGMKERANFLAKEAMDNNIPLTVEAYNYLILYCRDRFRNRDEAWECVLSYLHTMSNNHVSPNVETFNCVLYNLRGIGFMPQVCQNLARKVMQEMKICKIEPSLYTYQLLLDIFCSGRDPNQRVLEDILLALDGKNLTMQTTKDIHFFVSAMRLCAKTFGNPGLAYKLHDIVTQHENFLLLDYNESFKKDYYENFFMLLLRTEVLQNVMQVYDKYVPNTFVPSVQLLMEIIDAINLYQAFEYVPQICSDFLMFDYHLRENWVLDMLPRFCESSDACLNDEKVQNHLSSFVTSLLNMIQERADRLAEKQDRDPMDSRIYSLGLKIYLNAGHHEKAQNLVSKMCNERKNLTGQPILEALMNFVDTLFPNGGTTKHMKEAVTVACHFGDASVIEKALKICHQMNLPQSFRSSLIEIANENNVEFQEEDSSPELNEDPPERKN